MEENIIYKDNEYSWTKINEFWFNFRLKLPEKNAIVIRTAIKIEADSKEKFIDFLDKFQEKNYIIGHKNEKEKYMIIVLPEYSDEKIEQLLVSISNALTQINAEPACEKCGKVSRQGFTIENHVPIVVCNLCQEIIQEPEIDENFNVSEKKKEFGRSGIRKFFDRF